MPEKQKTPYQRADAERRLRQADRLGRILRLMQLMLGKGVWNARSLAQEQECSERTVYRDLNVLELAGVPWFFDEDRRCYALRPDFRFPVLNLTDEELLGQATATVLTKSPDLEVGTGAGPITRKLAQVSGEQTGKLLQDAERVMAVLDLKLADQGRHQETIRTVQWALIRGKQLAGQYLSPYLDKTVKLTLNPYRLCLVKQAWYVIARPLNGDRPKTYRVARFKSMRMLDAQAEVDQDFDLRAYFGNAWGVYRGDQTYDVAIEFSREAAALVTETTWHHSQEVQWHQNGTVTLTFRVDGLSEILWWILGWAGRARVVQPAELRDMVVEQCGKMIELHQGAAGVEN